MDLKLNLPRPKIHNYFDFVITDTETKEVRKIRAENIVLNQCYNTLLGGVSLNKYRYISIGDGVGTISPTRTSLFNQFWNDGITSYSVITTPDLVTISGKIVLNEASHVGKTITEVGFSCQNSGYTVLLFTHALLQDSEGNPISIVPKTNTQIIEIYLTIYIQRTEGLRPFPNSLSNIFTYNQSSSINMLTNMTVLPQNINIGITGTYNSNTKTYTTGVRSLAAASGNTVSDYNMAGLSYPTTDILSIDIQPLNLLTFPNHAAFAPFTFSERTIGTGDGTKRFFNLDSGYFIDGSETIKVGGAVQTRGVDYITHQGGRQVLNVSYALPYNSNIVPEIYNTNSSKGGRVFVTNAVYNPGVTYMSPAPTQYFLMDLKEIMYLEQIWINFFDTNVGVFASADDISWTQVRPISGSGYAPILVVFPQPMMVRYLWFTTNRTVNNALVPLIFGQPSIEFINPVASSDVVTATWTTEIPPKNANLFYNIQAAITGTW